MILYVANPTRQHHRFAFRLPESSGTVVQEIRKGCQVRVARSGGKTALTSADVNAIIDQHRMYGILPLDEALKAKAFVGKFYSIDKPVSSAQLLTVFKRNEEVLKERGRVMREQTALSVDSAIKNSLDGSPAKVESVEVSAIELEPPGGYQTMDPFADGYRVLPSIDGEGGSRKGRARRK